MLASFSCLPDILGAFAADRGDDARPAQATSVGCGLDAIERSRLIALEALHSGADL